MIAEAGLAALWLAAALSLLQLVLSAGELHHTRTLLFTSSACIYPGYLQKEADVTPLKEEDAYPADAEDGSPVWARLVGQWGNLAMFAGHTDLAIERFRRSAELNRVGGQRVSEVMTEICVCQVMAYGGRAEEARRLLPDLAARASRTGNPSAVAWAAYVTGEATGGIDVDDATRLGGAANVLVFFGF